jgi:tryptophan synthase beta subunit
MGKLMMAGAFATGYVLGSKAGRERYEQIRRTYARVMGNRRVQQIVTSLENRAMNRYNRTT